MKIAILRRNGYGDLICTAPLAHCLEESFPEAEITFFIDERNQALFPYLFPHHKAVVFGRGNKYWQVVKTALKKRKEFDLVVSAKPTPMKLNNVFLGLLKSQNSMAVTNQKAWHEKLVTTPRTPPLDGHQALRCLRVFDPTIQTISPNWFPKFKKSISPFPLQLPAPVLFFSLISNRPTSQLEASRFAQIANRLYTQKTFSVAISCKNQSEAFPLQELLLMPSQAVVTPSFNDYLSLLAACDLFLTADGGPCHLAACLDKPQVSLYGRTSLDQWSPLSEKALCLHDPEHIDNIDTNRIEKALLEAFSRI